MAGSVPATLAISWNGGPVFVTNAEVSDTSVSAAYPAHLLARPPKNSNAAFWQTNSGNSIFVLTIPNDTVIDLSVDLVMSDQTDVATQSASSAATSNQYFLALDGPGSNVLVPQSLNTTH
jgi:hypothetical protein